jgi:hypothetical protein
MKLIGNERIEKWYAIPVSLPEPHKEIGGLTLRWKDRSILISN